MHFSTIISTLPFLFTLASAASLKPRTNDGGDSTLSCAGQVFSPEDYTCIDNRILCPITKGHVSKLCGWDACYFDSQYVCIDGYFLCPAKAPNKCGEACYSEKEYVCCGTTLCPVEAPKLCGTACYNPAKYGCENGKLVQV